MPKIVKAGSPRVPEVVGQKPLAPALERERAKFKTTAAKGLLDAASEALSLAKELKRLEAARERTAQVRMESEARIAEAEGKLETVRIKYTVEMKGKLNDERKIAIFEKHAAHVLEILETLRPAPGDERALDAYLKVHDRLAQMLALLPGRGR